MRSLQITSLLSLLVLGACTLVVDGGQRSPAPHPGPPPHHPQHAALKIPPGHLPPPGMCRVWIPGRPPGHQPPPSSCRRVEQEVSPGAWVLYRPAKEKVRVSVYDQTRTRVVVAIRYYDAFSGEFLYERGT
jgi:hypothetical protein